jgi:hypothetical protein
MAFIVDGLCRCVGELFGAHKRASKDASQVCVQAAYQYGKTSFKTSLMRVCLFGKEELL